MSRKNPNHKMPNGLTIATMRRMLKTDVEIHCMSKASYVAFLAVALELRMYNTTIKLARIVKSYEDNPCQNESRS